MSKWFLAAKKADFQQIANTFSIDPVIARIIRNRDVVGDEQIYGYLHGTSENLHSYTKLKGMEQAVALLTEQIKEHKKIRIIGDYDVDGICSTYILYKGICLCGGNADYVIPDRIKDGYGINKELIADAVKEGVDVILTCDNGIAAKEAFDYAKENGLTCIITDHHEVPFEEKDGEKRFILPDVDALIDPKQPDETYPFPGICGAFVAYKLIEGVLMVFGIDASCKKELLELAGLATVCDVMELKDENRILVKAALSYMQDSDNLGLHALIKMNQLDSNSLSAYHLGFVIGPCINATGRLDSARIAMELLCSQRESDAIVKAKELISLNTSRKEMTELGIAQADRMIKQDGLLEDKVLVVFIPDLHESLAGIVAGRIREQYERPAFVITRAEEGAKGSARSIDAYHIYEEMTKCQELFTKFGGHKLAAGFSMEEKNIPVFRKKINELCTLQEEDFERKIVIDVAMPLSYVTKEFVEELSVLEPFGTGNEKPVFAQKNVNFIKGSYMGKNGNMVRFLVKDETGNSYNMLMFRGLENFETILKQKYGENCYENLFSGKNSVSNLKMDVLYYPSINEFRGKTEIQFIISDIR